MLKPMLTTLRHITAQPAQRLCIAKLLLLFAAYLFSAGDLQAQNNTGDIFGPQNPPQQSPVLTPPQSPILTPAPTDSPSITTEPGTDDGAPLSCPGIADGSGNCPPTQGDPTEVNRSVQPRTSLGNPINLMSGNKSQPEVDFKIPGAQLSFRRMYNSVAADTNVGLGQGWTHTYAVSLFDAGNGIREIIQSNGSRLRFTPDGTDGNGYPLMRGNRPNLGYVIYKDNRHEWHLPDGRTLTFNGSYLISINWPDQRNLTLYYRSRRLHSVTDETGRVLRLNYYAGGRAGMLNSYDRNRFGEMPGHLASLTLPDGSEIHYDYDNLRNLTRARFSDNTSREYHYEDETYPNHLTGLTDRTGVRFASWSYDEHGRAISSEHADGVEKVTLSYPSPAQVAEGGVVQTIVTNSLGYESQYTWQQPRGESQPRLLASSGAGCATCAETGYGYVYDEQGRLLKSTKTGLGNTVGSGYIDYRYDEQGRIAEIRRTDEAGQEQLVERREYEGATSNVIRLYQPSVNPDAERVISYERNERGLPVRIVSRGFTPWVVLPGEAGYLPNSNEPAAYRPIEKVNTFEYDDERLIRIDGPRTDVDDTTHLTWDDRNRLVTIKRPASASMRIVNFDTMGRPVKMQSGNVGSFEMTYDQNSNITTIAHRGLTSQYQYDAEARATSFTDAYGRTTRILRDKAGRLTGMEDSFGRRSDIVEDSENHTISKSYFGIDGSLLRTVEQSFYDNGRKQSQTLEHVNAHGESSIDTLKYELDENNVPMGISHAQTGLTLDVEFDTLLRSVSLSADQGLKTIAYFDRLGNETGKTDYRSNTTRHIRDDFGQRVAVSSPDTGVERLERNSAGDVVRRVREDSGATVYTFDAAGRVLTRIYEDGAVTRYEYHVDTGRLSRISNEESSETFEYSEHGDLLVHSRTMGSQEFVTRLRHDSSGRLLEKSLPDGQTLLYRYHTSGVNVGTLKSIGLKRLFGQQEMLVSDIDIEKRDGDLGWQSHNALQTHIDLSPGGQVVEMNTPGIQHLTYQYNAEQKVVGINNSGSQSTYQYQRGFLTSVESANTSHYYEYDSLGNRRAQYDRDVHTDTLRGTEYQYAESGAGNRLIQSRDMLSGTIQQRTYTAGGAPTDTGTLRYRYDGERRPIQVHRGSQLIASYAYNALGERVSKTVYTPDAEPVTTYFIYDDGVLSGEMDATVGSWKQYVYLDKHRPVVQLDGREINAIHTDNLGTPTAMSDDNAEAVWRADYSPFGLASIVLDERVLNLRFPGQYADDETGTHYNYFRDYDPATGRYLTSDPIGLAGGDNGYVYALLNPLGLTDVWGLFAVGDSLTEFQMQNLNGNPIAIMTWVENNLQTFEDRENFYYWVHSTVNSTESERQTNWFLAAAQVNGAEALGAMDDVIPNFVDIVEDETLAYTVSAGLGLAEQNLQTFLSLYFGQSIEGVDPTAPPGTCGIQLYGSNLDLQLVAYEQYELSSITLEYFRNDQDEYALVTENLNDLLNYRGVTGAIATTFGLADANTIMVVEHFWPDGDFEYTNTQDRILLGESLVKINNGEEWR